MKLVKLEFNGFKSFYDKTKIDFHSSINAIVGPNGCGKSNIIDAIKWVMGEQNPRNLRAMTMDEVISNGGETLKPLGMAEVSIVISANGTGYEEINVKRRLFRSGQSEYYINNVPCRLKDITELFVDTGIGARAYSIIGQGKVESIIMSKPEGKREVIEEVAGIGKYKLRRKETQSRIESTRNNLTVVRESQAEILRQIKSLKKQAQDAEKYKKVADEIEQIEYKVLVKKKNELVKSKTDTESMHKNIDNDISDHLQTLGGLKLNREDTLAVIENIDKEADILKNKYFEDTKKLQSVDNEIELVNREETTLYETISTIKTDLINSLKEIQNIKNITVQKHNDLKSTLISLQEKQNELSVKQKLTDSYKYDLITKKQEYKQHREGLLKSLDEYGSVKTKVVGIEKDVKELESRIYRLNKEKTDVQNRISLNTAKLRHHENELRKNVVSYTEVGGNLNNVSKDLNVLQSSKNELISKLEKYREPYNQAKSDLTAIEKIQLNYEWLPNEFSKFILNHKGREVVGLLADFIDVAQSYDKAVEAALGEKLKWAVINNLSEGFELIDLVNKQRTGKGTFLPLNLFNDKPTELHDKIDLKPLLDVIEVDHKISSLLSSLLDKVFITDSLQSIQNIDQKLKSGYSFVTLGGDYIDSSGFISGGDSSEGVFERKREIDQLSDRISELSQKIGEVDTKLRSTESKYHSLSALKIQQEAKLKELEIKEAGLNKDIINLKNICKSELDNLDSIVFETKSYQAERGNKVLSLSDLSKYINELELKKTQFETGFKNLDSELKELEDKDQQISTFVNQSKVEIAGLKEKINGLEQELSYYLLRQKELGIKIIIQQSDFKKLTYKKAGIVRSKIALGKDKEDIKARISVDNENMSISSEKKREIEQEILSYDRKISQVSEQIDALNKSSSELDLRLNSIDIELKHLSSTKDLNGLQYSVDELDFVAEEMENKLEGLKGRLQRFGPVNLLAPDEYLKLEDRNKFLTEQVEDLENAMDSLSKAINKLDRESKARFKETFDQVNEKFLELFPQIFRGGEGKLELTDSDDLLNTGVEVYVRPKGKKFQSINLLSGGEKALSAITLILSACFIKPAPFLLFDEIDAPLDDSNTRSFLEVIKQISMQSQILLITHNKNTMHDVNYLIGITSQVPGTSKVVSVELH